MPNLESKEFDIVTLNKKIPMHIHKDGMLSECYNTKQALIINDVTQSFLYKEKRDNFLEYSIKDLLLAPVLDDTPQKKVLAILWASIPEGSWNQYTQKDLDYMTKFSIFIKKFLQEKDFISQDNVTDAGVTDCM